MRKILRWTDLGASMSEGGVRTGGVIKGERGRRWTTWRGGCRGT